jgi:glutathione S-transferase
VIKLYEVPFSTNVERVQLALAHKGLTCEHIVSSYADRSLVTRVSGQGLVPVLDHDGQIVIDSMEIVRYL